MPVQLQPHDGTPGAATAQVEVPIWKCPSKRPVSTVEPSLTSDPHFKYHGLKFRVQGGSIPPYIPSKHPYVPHSLIALKG